MKHLKYTISLLAFTVSGAALAQDQTDANQDNVGLQDIVVTAQRRSESLKDVPISVTALSQSDLERQGVTEVQNLQFTTTAVTFPSDNGAATPYIRGVGTGFSGQGLEGSVALYIDDQYIQSQLGATSQLLDLQQIQILKGPQGTLYGRNATGGALVITTANPKLASFEGYLKGGIGNLGSRTVDGVVNLPLGTTFALRIAGGYEWRGDYIKNVVDGKKHGGFERGLIRVKALWQPTEEFSVVAKGEYGKSNGQLLRQQVYDATGAPSGLGFYETKQSPVAPGELDAKVYTANLQLKYETDTFQVSNVFGFRQVERQTCADQDNEYPVFVQFCNQDPSKRTFYDATFTNELRASTTFDGPINFAAGLFYEHQDAQYIGAISGLAFGPLMPVFDNHNSLNSYAAYGEAYWKFAPGFTLTVGGRYSIDKKFHSVDSNADVALIAPGAPLSFEHRAKFKNFTPRVVLAYENDVANYYVSYNKGFKSGGFNAPTFGLQPALKPEKIESFEAGAKFSLIDRRLRLNLAAFHYNWKDVQVAFVDTATGGLFQQNAAGVKVWGLEADAQFALTRAFSINVGANYLHSRYSSYPSAAAYTVVGGSWITTTQDLKDFPTTNSPDFTANGGATYDVDLPGDWSASITATARYTTKYYFQPGGGGPLRYDMQKAFTTANLTGTITPPGERFELGWYVNNLFDKKYNEAILTQVTGTYRIAALPRTYGATLKVIF
ncbi:hypothetical protein DM806_01875 [Sphingobium lactosutens]|uniref:TonB-dependent receptor n=1 Tax=Sphingobium lactosutens TaxID=522773 RepID=UPI0015BA06C7|nr:TonB-dependent receptor [Sphingobium lactosutens]NWK94453.1 hypothetical protein [Sphingobium lactosutens]